MVSKGVLKKQGAVKKKRICEAAESPILDFGMRIKKLEAMEY